MKINRRTKFLAITAASAVLLGVGVGASVSTEATNATPADPKLASLMAARSPGARSSAALSTKAPVVKQVAFTPTLAPSSEVLSERTPVTKVASASPVAAILPPPAATAPAVLAPAAPLAVAAPVAFIPAAAPALVGGGSSLLGAAAIIPIIPAVLGGGGGGGSGTVSLAPPVPEPATWMMMITGFGVLGFALRRRRRQERLAKLGMTKPGSGSTAVARSA